MTMFGLTPKEALAVNTGPKRSAMGFQILQYVASTRGATCDECETALGFAHQSASARYFELVHAGLLVPTGKRKTKAGAQATVHKVLETADFKQYLRFTSQKAKRARPGLTPTEQEVLRAGMEFLASWKKARSGKGRENAAVTLVNKLGALAAV
jgi:hypothetical protein